MYRDGILYDGLNHLTAGIRREIYTSLSLIGVLSADGVELTTEVTEYALRLTKAAQQWAEEQDLYDGQNVADKLLYKGSPISTVLRLSGRRRGRGRPSPPTPPRARSRSRPHAYS